MDLIPVQAIVWLAITIDDALPLFVVDADHARWQCRQCGQGRLLLGPEWDAGVANLGRDLTRVNHAWFDGDRRAAQQPMECRRANAFVEGLPWTFIYRRRAEVGDELEPAGLVELDHRALVTPDPVGAHLREDLFKQHQFLHLPEAVYAEISNRVTRTEALVEQARECLFQRDADVRCKGVP